MLTTTKSRMFALLVAVMPLMAAACEDVATAPAETPHTAHKDGPSRKRLAACEAVTRQEYRKEPEEEEDIRRVKKACRGVSRSKFKQILVKIIREETPTLPTRSATQS